MERGTFVNSTGHRKGVDVTCGGTEPHQIPPGSQLKIFVLFTSQEETLKAAPVRIQIQRE